MFQTIEDAAARLCQGIRDNARIQTHWGHVAVELLADRHDTRPHLAVLPVVSVPWHTGQVETIGLDRLACYIWVEGVNKYQASDPALWAAAIQGAVDGLTRDLTALAQGIQHVLSSPTE